MLDGPANQSSGAYCILSLPEGVCKDNTDGNVRVVKRLEVDRVELLGAKDDRDERVPEHDGGRDWAAGRWAVVR